MTRFFDILFSALGLLLLSPFMLLIALLIICDDPRGGAFYTQWRVGRYGKEFRIHKFRTMRCGSDKAGLLTVGGRDSRITRVGYFLRKYKLDELPQLWDVFRGKMSLVGPRPEVKKYVDVYTDAQRVVLNVRPGITDYASIAYMDENDILAAAADPDRAYIEQVMPAKIAYNMQYINHPSVSNYFGIIFRTIGKIFSSGREAAAACPDESQQRTP